jgi:hypothetical protein
MDSNLCQVISAVSSRTTQAAGILVLVVLFVFVSFCFLPHPPKVCIDAVCWTVSLMPQHVAFSTYMLLCMPQTCMLVERAFQDLNVAACVSDNAGMHYRGQM